MRSYSSLIYYMTALYLLVTSHLASAQSAGANSISEIIVRDRYLYSNQVNALRTPTPLIDSPQSLSIVTAEQMRLQGFTAIGDIISYTPGVSMSQGEGHRDALVIRGVRSTADFYLDGARDDVQYYRSLYNLEQVEIIRGPNALLFGRGGTGGILNRVSKKGVVGENFTDYQAGTDSFGEYSLQLDTNQSLGGDSALRFNAFYESLNNQRDFYNGERIGLNPTYRFMMDPDTRIDLSYEYADHQRFIDRGIPTGSNGRPIAAFSDIVFADPDLNHNELKAHLLRAIVQHDFSETMKGNVSLFYGVYDKLYQNFYVSAFDQASTSDKVTLDGYIDTTERKNLIFSGNLIREFSAVGFRHTLIAGAENIDTASNQDRFNSFWSTTLDDNEVFSISRPLSLSGGVGLNSAGLVARNDFSTDINDDTRVNIGVNSLYLQDEIEISEKLDFVLGARFDSFDIDVFNVVAAENRSRTDEKVTPRLGLVLKPIENISLYASYSESFLPRSGEQYEDINGNNNQLDPDTYENLEVGLKWDFTLGVSLTAAVFEIRQSSPQVADTDPSTLDIIDSEINGLELQLQGQLMDRLLVSTAYSYLDGEQVDRFGPSGLRPTELPQDMFSVWILYQINNSLGLSLGVTYQDESYINNGNTASLPAFTRTDAGVFYDFSESLRVQLHLENLGDKQYFPNAHSTHQVTVGAPFNARISISGRF